MMTTGYRLIGAALATSLVFASSLAANIPEAAKEAGDFRSLLKASETAGFSSYVDGQGSFTMFAPNDAGFAKAAGRTIPLAEGTRHAMRAVA